MHQGNLTQVLSFPDLPQRLAANRVGLQSFGRGVGLHTVNYSETPSQPGEGTNVTRTHAIATPASHAVQG